MSGVSCLCFAAVLKVQVSLEPIRVLQASGCPQLSLPRIQRIERTLPLSASALTLQILLLCPSCLQFGINFGPFCSFFFVSWISVSKLPVTYCVVVSTLGSVQIRFQPNCISLSERCTMESFISQYKSSHQRDGHLCFQPRCL